MTVEIIVSLCVVVVCISPLIILGIVQYNSKNPVGFWAGQEPHKAAEISDIRAYNHKHGIMWITYGIGFISCRNLMRHIVYLPKAELYAYHQMYIN